MLSCCSVWTSSKVSPVAAVVPEHSYVQALPSPAKLESLAGGLPKTVFSPPCKRWVSPNIDVADISNDDGIASSGSPMVAVASDPDARISSTVASTVLSLQLRAPPPLAGGEAFAPDASGRAAATVVEVRSLSGDVLAELEVDLVVDSLSSLRADIQDRTGVRRERQKLSFGGRACCADFAESTKLCDCFRQLLSTIADRGAARAPPLDTSPVTAAVLPAAAAASPKRLPGVPPRTLSGGSGCAPTPSTGSFGGPRLPPRPLALASGTEAASPVRGGGVRHPPPRIGSLALDTVESSALDTRVWSEDVFGTILHKPSGLRVSPENGIQIDGVVHRLAPEDIELPDDAFLGSGSGGVVQVGWHKPSGKRVAVKTLRVGTDNEKREQMLNEITGLAQVAGCPYLVQWYAGFADPASGTVCLAIEFMDLGSLADLRKRLKGEGFGAAQDQEQAMCIAAQIVRGVAQLQMRSLLHRDVKPENILHNRAGNVKLTDFGISKDLSAVAAVCTTFVGTVTYMSPERAAGSAYGYESDVWSAGMVIYELSTGEYPFNSASFPELFECLCERPEPRLDAAVFRRPLCDLVERCLTREVAARPDAQTLASHELVAGLSEGHVASFAAWLGRIAPPE